MRKKIVAGNWKMHKTYEEGLQLVSEALHMLQDEVKKEVHTIFIPPFPYMQSFVKYIKSSPNIHIGAQNCADADEGAYTGEVAAKMLASIGVKFVIVGHSERRAYFQENVQQLAQKIDVSLKYNLTPIFCCGEPKEIREKYTHIEYVCMQIQESLWHLTESQILKIVLAYEPVWAIGTGLTATSQQAQEMHRAIRAFLAQKYGQTIADQISILYGGSCKPDNAKELFACPDVDGGLIGGASLKSRDFVDIVKSI